MDKETRILIIEDLPPDVELTERELRKADIAFTSRCVETKEAFLKELAEFEPDIILSDYSLPQFNGMEALRLLRELGTDVPFILITGSLTEEVAVECMKEGAHDYILKTSLKRLSSAVLNALEKKQVEQEREQALGALRRSEELYRLLAENTRDLICMLDVEGNYVYASPSFSEVLGYDPKELLGRRCSSLIHPEDKKEEAQRFRDALSRKKGYSAEFRYRHRSGEWIIFETKGNWVFDWKGNPSRAVFVSRDITERRRTEELLRAADRRAVEEYERLLARLANLALTFGTARDLLTIYRGLRDFSLSLTPSFALAICHYDEEREVREGVYFCLKDTELDTAAVVGMPVSSGPVGRAIKTGEVIVSNDYLKDLSERTTVCIGFDEDGEEPRSALIVPMTIMGRTIGTIEVQSHEMAAYTREHVTAMQLAGNLAAHAIENVRLLNLEREKEEQLRQSQKLEAVGQLAGGIAHDFNNLLTVITGHSDLTLRRVGDEPLRHHVEEIKRAGERAASLTRQLLAFSRKQVLQPRVLELNTVVADMDKMLRRLLDEDIDLVTTLDPALGQVKADPGQMEQVILNLAVNARDAMPDGGKLTIETANVYLDESYSQMHASVRPGHYVMLAVSDAGCGMSAEVQARIFEPFFTTKEPDKGTGLGLSTVYGIVKQSGGNIWVYSEVGRGTTFKVYLPRVDEQVERSSLPVLEGAAPRGRETVLLVEDEQMVRDLTASLLREQGYNVLEARNGQEALRVAQEHTGGQIHLLLTDMVMPGMNGRELSERLLPGRPNMRVLFMSGYTNRGVVRQGILDESTAFLQKPFTLDALANKIREVLDAPAMEGGEDMSGTVAVDNLELSQQIH